MEYAQLVIDAILIEAIWENLKMIWKDRKISLNTIGVLVISIVVCLLAKIDIFPIVGLSLSVPFVGSGLTGIIVSRCANFVNDLFEKLKVK